MTTFDLRSQPEVYKAVFQTTALKFQVVTHQERVRASLESISLRLVLPPLLNAGWNAPAGLEPEAAARYAAQRDIATNTHKKFSPDQVQSAQRDVVATLRNSLQPERGWKATLQHLFNVRTPQERRRAKEIRVAEKALKVEDKVHGLLQQVSPHQNGGKQLKAAYRLLHAWTENHPTAGDKWMGRGGEVDQVSRGWPAVVEAEENVVTLAKEAGLDGSVLLDAAEQTLFPIWSNNGEPMDLDQYTAQRELAQETPIVIDESALLAGDSASNAEPAPSAPPHQRGDEDPPDADLRVKDQPGDQSPSTDAAKADPQFVVGGQRVGSANHPNEAEATDDVTIVDPRAHENPKKFTLPEGPDIYNLETPGAEVTPTRKPDQPPIDPLRRPKNPDPPGI